MGWDSRLLKNFPQFLVIHTVKSFGRVNKAEVDAFLEFSCFFYDPTRFSPIPDKILAGFSVKNNKLIL